MIGQDNSPLLEFSVKAEGRWSPKKVTAIEFELTHGIEAINEIRLHDQRYEPGKTVAMDTNIKLDPGTNMLAITCELSAAADIDAFVSAKLHSFTIDGNDTIDAR